MRRIISILLTVLMVASMCTFVSFGASAEEAVIPAEPTLEILADTTGYTALSSKNDFGGKKAVFTDPNGKYYLTADITLDSTIDMEFAGELHGNGHTITVSAPLFENLKGATISNLKIVGNVSAAGADNIGLLANIGGAVTITNVITEGSVKHTSSVAVTASAAGFIGMLSSDSASTFTNCYNKAEVVGMNSNPQGAAGIVGLASAGDLNLNGCVNTGAITGYNDAAGIVGYSKVFINAENCVNAGVVVATNDAAGGIVGHTDRGFEINNCKNTNSVSGKATAGIVANMGQKAGEDRIFTNCVNSGHINGTTYAAGMAGYLNVCKDIIITKCINNGEITGDLRAAGIVAFTATCDSAKFEYCVNTASVTGVTQVGGIIGYMSSINAVGTADEWVYQRVAYCFNSGDITKHKCDDNCVLKTSTPTCNVAGIVAGTTGSGGSYRGPQIVYCGSTGKITNNGVGKGHNNSFTCGILGYANITIIDFHDNFFAGTLSGLQDKTFPFAAIGQHTLKDGDAVADRIVDNYYVANESIENVAFVGDKTNTPASVPATTVAPGYTLTAEDVTSGKLAYLMQEATGEAETIWGQTIGTDNAPVLFGEKVVPFRTIYINAYITKRALSLAESFNYEVYAKVSVNTAPKMAFTVNGVKTEVEGEATAEDGIYLFSFDGIAPQLIASDITAELILGKDIADAKTASILDYCESLYETTEDAELKTLVEKVFLYGAEARNYVVAKELYTAEALPAVTSEIIKASVGEIPTYDGSVVTVTGTGASFESANVFFDATNKIIANFTVAEGIDPATVTVNGQAIGAPDANGVYTYTTEAQYAKYYDTPVSIVLAVGGEAVETLEYSVSIYARRIANSAEASAEMRALAAATYEYGVAAAAYAN